MPIDIKSEQTPKTLGETHGGFSQKRWARKRRFNEAAKAKSKRFGIIKYGLIHLGCMVLLSVATSSNASPPGIAASKSTTAGLCFLASERVLEASRLFSPRLSRQPHVRTVNVLQGLTTNFQSNGRRVKIAELLGLGDTFGVVDRRFYESPALTN